jgi:DNA-binding SARP family transcriptional activator
VLPPLEIRVLGELQIIRGGNVAPLPASKKTRALIGYLVVASTRMHTRQRLCELFWEGPDDPRAALRWSLTKARPLVDDEQTTRITADREHVTFEPRGASVDLLAAREGHAALASASLDALRATAASFRGELLEGLELPDCYRYHEWCIAEREAARKLRSEILAALIERLGGAPEEALRHARVWVATDPLAEAGHIAVLRLLDELGRPRDALKQYESCRRMLQSQLGRGPSRELEAARALVGSRASTAAARAAEATPDATAPFCASAKTPVAQASAAPSHSVPFVGRSAERAQIARAVSDAVQGRPRALLLFAGEPGIGKTRVLTDAVDQMIAHGGAALTGRAFEAEMIRPYGAWIDALRSGPDGALDDVLRGEIGPLPAEPRTPRPEADRNRLFDAVGALLRRRADATPLIVGLDDVQWLDEASVGLLHYLARSLTGTRVLLACAARAAEMDDNPPLRALVRGLGREGRLARFDLAPLDAAETAALVRAVHVDVDAGRVFVDGGGNPLFSLELARVMARRSEPPDDAAAPHRTLDGLIADRLARLEERASEVLPWAAALGRAFTFDTLASVTPFEGRELFAAVEDLERHGVLRVAGAEPGVAGYDFAHDLVRRAAYRALSEPRRRWVHLQIARTLGRAADPEGLLAGDVAHHAAMGGDSELAARSYLAAAERSLRLLAHADANRLAGSGLQHVGQLAPELALRLRLGLLAVQVHSNQWLRRAHELDAELLRVVSAAERLGMHAEVSRAFYLMSFLGHELGDPARAGARTLQAAHAVRSADAATAQMQLANTACCLALIERDLVHADCLLREAQELGPPRSARASFELCMGIGLLAAFRGEAPVAQASLEQAAEWAARLSDNWRQCMALTRLVRLALESSRPQEAVARCAELAPLVAELSEGSERPFVAALDALARIELGERGAPERADSAIGMLRAIDSKAQLAYVLSASAEHDVAAGRTVAAERRAREAFAAARAVDHRSEMAVARSLLARIAVAAGAHGEAREHVQACDADRGAPLVLSARARLAVLRAAKALEDRRGDA